MTLSVIHEFPLTYFNSLILKVSKETKFISKKYRQGRKTHGNSGHFKGVIVGFFAYSVRVFLVIVGATSE